MSDAARNTPAVVAEIASQPECWRRAAAVAAERAGALPGDGERVAVVGCGTSWFMAQAYATLREAAGRGETDAFAASEFPADRRYDRLVAISRSGTTTEVLDLLRRLAPTTATVVITGIHDAPMAKLAGETIVLDFADETSVVQTRFATTALALLRASLGEDMVAAAGDAEKAVAEPLPLPVDTTEQVTFLGRGWTVGLANEAALKCREAATFWTESYPAMEYRHGPISITAPNRATWMFGTAPDGLADDVAPTGGTFVTSDLDPMADLIRAQRFAIAVADHRGLDPDHPRHLTRSVILA
ncbi:MAG TPA: sugar isomerase [Actinocatenispora sp.]